LRSAGASEKYEAEDSLVTGFNVGVNNGKTAGQTIMHAHIHLIPRRTNDVRSPRGGIEMSFPAKAAIEKVGVRIPTGALFHE
jgi:diadenosine tetraphosphate (Ap4A) HIT family hydrolase